MTTMQKFLIAAVVAIFILGGIFWVKNIKKLRAENRNDAKLSSTPVQSSVATILPAEGLPTNAGSASEETSEIQTWLKKLQSSDSGDKARAVQAIGKLGTKGKGAVPFLIPLLSDKNESIRMLTARALGKIGIAAKEALPALRKYAETSKLTERTLAEHAIGKIEK